MRTLLKLIFLITLTVGFVACDSISLPTDNPSPTNPTDPTPEPEPTPDKSNPSDAKVIEALPNKPEVTENGYAWDDEKSFIIFWDAFQDLSYEQIILFNQTFPLKSRTLRERIEDPTEAELQAEVERQGLKENEIIIFNWIIWLQDPHIGSLLDEEGLFLIGDNIIIFNNLGVYKVPKDQLEAVQPIADLTPAIAEENKLEFLLPAAFWGDETLEKSSLNTQQTQSSNCTSNTFITGVTQRRVLGDSFIRRLDFFGIFEITLARTTARHQQIRTISFLGNTFRYWGGSTAGTLTLSGDLNTSTGNQVIQRSVNSQRRVIQRLNITPGQVSGDYDIQHRVNTQGEIGRCETTESFALN